MHNLELLRARFPIIDSCWWALAADTQLPTVILALRDQSLSVNISLESRDLDSLWRRLTGSDLAPNFARLAACSNRVVLDVTAGAEGLSEQRLWAYAWNITNFSDRAEQWPCASCDFTDLTRAVGLGIYAGRTSYKYYYQDLERDRLIKDTYDSAQLISRQEEQRIAALSEEEIARFNLTGLDLNWDHTAVNGRVDQSAAYITIWN